MEDKNIIKISKHIVYRDINNKIYIYDLIRQKMYMLNKDASEIWRQINNKRCCNEIVKLVLNETNENISYNVLSEKIISFVDKFRKKGILFYDGEKKYTL